MQLEDAKTIARKARRLADLATDQDAAAMLRLLAAAFEDERAATSSRLDLVANAIACRGGNARPARGTPRSSRAGRGVI
jgi:hypothetical protein